MPHSFIQTIFGDLVKHIVHDPWTETYKEMPIGVEVYKSGADFSFTENFGK